MRHTLKNALPATIFAVAALVAVPAHADDDYDDDSRYERHRAMAGHHCPMGWGGKIGGQVRAQPLSAAEVETLMKARLIRHANPNLKVGEIRAAGDDAILADIVTKDGSLVQRFRFDTRTGWSHPLR